MPSRKQRRRREKSFRHEYDLVLLDEEGNEVELDPEERRAKREEKESTRAAARPATKKQPAGSTRGMREPPQPSWDRALRRGGIMGGLMLLAFMFLFKNAPIGIRFAWGLFYAAAFVPLTYFVDRTAYRSYQRRLAKKTAPKN
jgi:hypothetical protein